MTTTVDLPAVDLPASVSTRATGRATGKLTVASGTALYIGAVLGTGVIALPALAAQVAGPASLLAWLGLIILSVPLAHTFAALGARYPDAGGVSTYVRLAFGPRAAAVVGWCFYFAVPVGSPAAAVFAGAYVAHAVGGGSAMVIAAGAGIMAVVALTNAFGVKVSGRVQLGLAALLILLLIIAAASSLPHARVANLQPFAPHGWAAILPAAALLVWSFAGWEAITHLAADFRRPARDLPRATWIAVVVVGALYLLIATTTLLVLGDEAATVDAPLARLLTLGLGGSVDVIAAGAAVLLTMGTMNAYFAGTAKLGAALGRDGALPAWLARGSSGGEVPRRSLAIVAGLSGVVLAIIGVVHVDAKPLVLLTTGCLVAVYALGAAAAVRLLPRGSRARRSAWLALLSVGALLVTSGWYMVWPLAIAVAAIIYVTLAPSRTARAGKLENA